jgi:hypothetical protein
MTYTLWRRKNRVAHHTVHIFVGAIIAAEGAEIVLLVVDGYERVRTRDDRRKVAVVVAEHRVRSLLVSLGVGR